MIRFFSSDDCRHDFPGGDRQTEYAPSGDAGRVRAGTGVPISREAVHDRVGDVRLDAPTGEGETISDVSGRCGEEEFASADELHDALVGFVSDEYVGRKFYDDRGSQPSEPEEEMSF